MVVLAHLGGVLALVERVGSDSALAALGSGYSKMAANMAGKSQKESLSVLLCPPPCNQHLQVTKVPLLCVRESKLQVSVCVCLCGEFQASSN